MGTSGRFRARSFSLAPEHDAAVDWLASQSGHGNASRAIQTMIDRFMIGKKGVDWPDDDEVRAFAGDHASSVGSSDLRPQRSEHENLVKKGA